MSRPKRFNADAVTHNGRPGGVPPTTYLTAMSQDQTIAFHSDPYGRDGVQLAAVDSDRARADRP